MNQGVGKIREAIKKRLQASVHYDSEDKKYNEALIDFIVKKYKNPLAINYDDFMREVLFLEDKDDFQEWDYNCETIKKYKDGFLIVSLYWMGVEKDSYQEAIFTM